MITSIILYMIYGTAWIVLSPMRLLDDATLPAGLTTALASVSDYLSSVNTFVPVDSFLTIAGILLTIESAIFTYKLIMWLIKKIPLIG